LTEYKGVESAPMAETVKQIGLKYFDLTQPGTKNYGYHDY